MSGTADDPLAPTVAAIAADIEHVAEIERAEREAAEDEWRIRQRVVKHADRGRAAAHPDR